MINLSPPPCAPVRWRIAVAERDTLGSLLFVFVHETRPKQTAFAAAQTIRRPDGTQPHFSECQRFEQVSNG